MATRRYAFNPAADSQPRDLLLLSPRPRYVELCGFDPGVVSQLYKRASINLCSNVDGQLMMGLMVNPPSPGKPTALSFAFANSRTRAIFSPFSNLLLEQC